MAAWGPTGATKKIVLTPEESYGARDDNLVMDVSTPPLHTDTYQPGCNKMKMGGELNSAGRMRGPKGQMRGLKGRIHGPEGCIHGLKWWIHGPKGRIDGPKGWIHPP
eukprot:4473615-Pyramimonas_sp.AAC.1